MKYIIGLELNTEYEIDADDIETAIEIAMDYFSECNPTVTFIEEGGQADE